MLRLESFHDISSETTSGGGGRIDLAGTAMSRLGYLRDRLFLAATGAYALNRWILKPRVDSAFLRGHFNDLLLIPAALPVMLWVQRKLGLRTHDEPPRWSEALLHLVVWSLICEWLGPNYLGVGTSDRWDVAAYAAGGIMACLWWNRPTRAG